MQGWKRFNLHFLDTCLMAIWLGLLGIALIGLVVTLVPGLQQVDAQNVFAVTAFGFLALSTARFIVNWEAPLYIMPMSYCIIYVLYWILVYNQMLPRPNRLAVGSIVPACVLSVLLIPTQYIWERIKPLPRARYVPRKIKN